MTVPTRDELEKLGSQLVIDPEENFSERLDESELDDNEFKNARIYLLAILDAFVEGNAIDPDGASAFYRAIGFSTQEMVAIRQNAELGTECRHQGS